MEPDLEQRLHAVYHHGYLEVPDASFCHYDDMEPLEERLVQQMAPLGLAVGDIALRLGGSPRVAVVHIGMPAADGQLWLSAKGAGGSRQARLAETGQPGWVCLVEVSAVYPAWRLRFNLWSAQDDPHIQARFPDSLKCESVVPPDTPQWNKALRVVAACCAAQGLVQRSAAELAEPVPFVTASVGPDTLNDDDLDDYNEELNGFTPSPIQDICDVEECLFWCV